MLKIAVSSTAALLSDKEIQVLDETEERILSDDSINDLLSEFARRHISDSEFLKRMIELRDIAQERAERDVHGPSEPDDVLARFSRGGV